MAGEFFVMQALYRLGHEPALTIGRAKIVDILLELASGRTVRISVKTSRGGGKWPVGDADFSKQDDLFFVFLYFEEFGDWRSAPEVYVVPAPVVQRLKGEWQDSYAVYYQGAERRKRLEPYRDAWQLLAQGSK